MSLLLWSSSSLRFNGMMACWNGISHFEATTERVLTHGRRLHLKTLTQKTPAWNNPIVKSVKRTECYIKKKYGLPCVTWWQSLLGSIGFKKQGEAYKSSQTLHSWAWRRKAPEEPECQVTPKRAWYYPFFRLPHPLYFFMSWFYLYLELIDDRQLWFDTENSR